jgi:hypothetical protein
MRRKVLSLAVAVSFLSACKTPTEVENETLVVTADPSPAPAASLRGVTYTVKGDDSHPDEIREYDWKTTFNVTVHDMKGLDGLKISGIVVTVQPASGGIVFNPRSDTVYFDYNVVASTNQVPKKGNASVAVEAWYDLPNAGREALVTVAVSLVDEDRFTYSDSVEVNIK